MYYNKGLHYLAHRELNELYISIAIREFALAMIGIFVPIFLINIGYSLIDVFIYYALANFFHAILTFPAAKISGRYGFKHIILFSIPFYLVFFALLYSIETHGLPLAIIALILGAQRALFWTGYHLDFAKFSDKKDRGKEVGKIRTVVSLSAISGPTIGGVILVTVGFNYLFSIVSILLLASAIPLFFSEDNHEKIDFKFRNVFKKRKIRDIMGFLGHGIENSVGGVIWPIFIFFSIIHQYKTLGIIYSISVLFSLFVIFAIGRYSDKHRRKTHQIGSILTSMVWIVRIFIINTIGIFMIDSIYGITHKTMAIPFNALAYDKANKYGILKYIIFREFVINIGATGLFVAMIFITNLDGGFLIGAGASLIKIFF